MQVLVTTQITRYDAETLEDHVVRLEEEVEVLGGGKVSIESIKTEWVFEREQGDVYTIGDITCILHLAANRLTTRQKAAFIEAIHHTEIKFL